MTWILKVVADSYVHEISIIIRRDSYMAFNFSFFVTFFSYHSYTKSYATKKVVYCIAPQMHRPGSSPFQRKKKTIKTGNC